MNGLTIAFMVCMGALLLALPRRLAVIPLLVGACYSGPLAVIDVGPASLTVFRVLVFVGLLRVAARGERIEGGLNRIDRLVIVWGVVMLLTGMLHAEGALTYRAGLIVNDLGGYLLLRVFVRDIEDVHRVARMVGIVLIPVALAMLLEKATGRNLFAALGGFADPNIRDGLIRARGPFVHPILAGTVGATSLALVATQWKRHRKLAMAGIAACLGIVFACTSSGPLMVMMFLLVGLGFWGVREHMRAVRWLALMAIIALDFVMKDPVYFLMARIDLTGSSKGYHRAQLIRSSIEHLDEWWLAGTDYTRHWMATGIHANAQHTDITNHLLANGVLGGLPLMTVFILVLAAGFGAVGKALHVSKTAPVEQQWLIWTLGAVLFAHVANFFSISLFDQSVVFFYLVLACIGGVHAIQAAPERSAAPVARAPKMTMTRVSQRPRMIRR